MYRIAVRTHISCVWDILFFNILYNSNSLIMFCNDINSPDDIKCNIHRHSLLSNIEVKTTLKKCNNDRKMKLNYSNK